MRSRNFDERQHNESLRIDAEARLARRVSNEAPPRTAEELLHELQVHQIELEMQNDELRRAYDALAESRDRYVDLYEFAPIGYLILSREGLISEINLNGATLLRAGRRKLVGSRFSRFVAPGDVDRWHRHVAQAFHETDQQNCELALQRSDGSIRHVRLGTLRVTERDTLVLRIAITDITERRKAELALEQADRHKAEFLAMLAHELRNPLASIRNAAGVVGLVASADPRVVRAQALIDSEVGHLVDMIENLVDISCITFDRIALKRESIEFTDLVQRVLDAVRPLIDSKQQQFTVRLPASAVTIEGDSTRLSQVLFNLLENANRYTPPGGVVEFDASLAGPELRITVRDNGEGIPPELLPRVFDLFQQGERTLDRPQGGLGVGLTLVKHLVEKHDGRVEARSDGPGRGATFTVWLPREARARAAPPPTTSPDRPTAAPSGGGIRVLVVDDDAAVADSTALLLETAGHEVRIAHDGPAAIALVPDYRPQAVLMDIGLAGIDGFETAKSIRQLPDGHAIRLIALTGYGDAQTRARALAAGCDELLVKPVRWAELAARLAVPPAEPPGN